MRIHKVAPVIASLLFRGFWRRMLLKHVLASFSPIALLFFTGLMLILFGTAVGVWVVVEHARPADRVTGHRAAVRGTAAHRHPYVDLGVDSRHPGHPRLTERPPPICPPSRKLPAMSTADALPSAVRAPRRVLLLAFLGFFLTIGAWSVAAPYSGSPDEVDHAVRAAGVVSGQIAPEPTAAKRGSGAFQTVPAGLVPRNLGCWIHKASINVSCAQGPSANRTLVQQATGAGRYQPLYYAAVGGPLRLWPGQPGLILARLISAALPPPCRPRRSPRSGDGPGSACSRRGADRIHPRHGPALRLDQPERAGDRRRHRPVHRRPAAARPLPRTRGRRRRTGILRPGPAAAGPVRGERDRPDEHAQQRTGVAHGGAGGAADALPGPDVAGRCGATGPPAPGAWPSSPSCWPTSCGLSR